MTDILTREQIHELLDAVLDITDGGHSENGYPYVQFEVGNYGNPISVNAMDDGFRKDACYDLFGNIASVKRLEDVLAHLRELKKSATHMPGKA